MKPYGIDYISPDLEFGDAYTRDYKKNRNGRRSKSWSRPTCKRILRTLKKRARREGMAEALAEIN